MRVNVFKLEQERYRLGLNKKSFAKHVGVNPQTLYTLMRFKSTTLKRLTSIAKRLEIDPKDLITD